MDYINILKTGTILQGKAYQYEIIKVLGQGSFGITYLASVKMQGDLGSIDAFVAIKEFFMSEINGRENITVTSCSNAGLFDKYKRKFIKEAKSLGKLRHPNIVRVIESFEANNTVYYAMDFIEGGSLDEFISQKGSLNEDEAINIANQILDALGYMHSRKMLHLDLKPSNVMVSHGKPILIDFGLSKQYDDEGNPESSTTIGGGTPGYAPIEQSNYNGAQTAKGSIPVTMDLYALGATMFKMISGKRPPIASNILNLGFPEKELNKVSSQTRDLIKSLMQPMWKDRPSSDDAVKSLFKAMAKDRTEGTEITDEIDIISIETSDKDRSKKNQIFFWMIATFIVICVLVGIIGTVNNWISISDESITTDSDTLAINSSDLSSPIAELPDVKYSITGATEYDDSNARLCATINGEKVVIGSMDYIFGPHHRDKLDIFAQEDFNGDGISDVLVYDYNFGSGGDSTWAFISYSEDGTFDKSNLFSIPSQSYYEPEISTVNGQKVLDFIKVDLGERIVKERRGLKNGHVINLELPGSKTHAYIPLQSINMDKLGEDGSFSYDLNGDGINEMISTTGSFHFGRSFRFIMNGKEYEFAVENALWGNGTLHILKTKTKGLHDIMIEQDTRLIYKWDGNTYSSD